MILLDVNILLKNILDKLAIDTTNGLYFTNKDDWKNEIPFPNRIRKILDNDTLKPTAFFCFDNKPLILFYLFPENESELHKAIWNFNESPIIIIINNATTTIYNGFVLEKNQLLQPIGGEEKLNDFSYFKLVTGTTWEEYQQQLNYKKRVDYKLLDNIKAVRKVLIENNKNRNSKIVNALIGKVIFVRYLIDKGVKLRFDGILKKWSNIEFCTLLKNPKKTIAFLKYLESREDGFNGDLFPLTADEYKQITQADLDVIKNLLQGNEIKTGQQSLFNLYDFSIIPIEFISNVYEMFIGKENQQEEGAYYTPLFLVDYILKETVDKKLNSQPNTYNCKVLDPACGSGIFLVETLRKIIEKFIEVTNANVKTAKFKTDIKKLVEDNIFGIDKDKSAVQVAIFSIYLTMLDYLEPAQIEDAFKFPNLLGTNFFEGDFFRDDLDFKVLKEYEFDFIVGNPPWYRGKGEKEKPFYIEYIEKRNKEEKRNSSNLFKPAIGDKQIAQAFIIRSSDFSSINTRIVFIVTSKILYTQNGADFRKYFLQECVIDSVFELAPVRLEVFEKSIEKDANSPASVLFFRFSKNQNTTQNIIEYISLKQSKFFTLFKIFTINRNDYQFVKQSILKQYDWLWKVLVYGSYLDFNFIKRLKEEYVTIKELISDDRRFDYGTGIQYSSNETYPSTHLKGKDFVDVYAVNNFFIDESKISEFDKNFVHRIRNEKLFENSILLIRKGMDMDHLVLKCAISKKGILFKDSLTGISILQDKDRKVLYQIGAVLASKLTSYYAVNTFGNIGIEREQTQNYDKFSLPYLEVNAKKEIEIIEKNNQLIFDENKKANETGLLDNIKISKAKQKIKEGFEAINKLVIDKIEPTDVELALLDYATNTNRIQIVGNELERQQLYSSIPFEDDCLTQYAQLFISRFKKKLDTKDQKFTIEIWHTEQIVGMFFKVVKTNNYKEPIQWISKQDNAAFIKFLFAMGQQKITEKLFIQKDIRGFDNNGDDFYIIKPNEKRLWHKAIGYLDVNEFAEAIIKTTEINPFKWSSLK